MRGSNTVKAFLEHIALELLVQILAYIITGFARTVKRVTVVCLVAEPAGASVIFPPACTG